MEVMDPGPVPTGLVELHPELLREALLQLLLPSGLAFLFFFF